MPASRRARTRHLRHLALLALLAAGLAGGAIAERGDASSHERTWLGTSSNVWTTASNWSGGNVPDTTAEVAVLPSGTFNDCSAGFVSPCAPVLSGGGGFTVGGIDQQSGYNGTTTISRQLTIGSFGLTVTSGTFDGGAVFTTINGPVLINGGTFLSSTNFTDIDSSFTHTSGVFNARTSTWRFANSAEKVIDPLTYVTNTTWRTNGSYSVGNRVIPTVPNGNYYEVTVSDGAAGATEPTWPTTSGGTVTLDGVTYQQAGRMTIFNVLHLGTSTTNGGPVRVTDGKTIVVSGQLRAFEGSLNQNSVPADGTIRYRNGSALIAETTFDGGTGQIVFDGHANQTLDSYTPNTTGLLPRIKVDKSIGNFTLQDTLRTGRDFEVAQLGGTLTMTGTTPTLALVGDLTFTQPSSLSSKIYTGTVTVGDTGNTVTLADGTVLPVSGTLRFASGGVLNKNGGGGTGTVSLSGSLTQDAGAGGGTAPITIEGTGASQVITGNSAGTGDLPPITINKSGTGSITISSKVRLTKSFTVQAIGSGTFTTTGSTLIFAGTAQTVTGMNVTNGSVSQVYNEVQIGESGIETALTLTNPLTATGLVTLRNGSIVSGTLTARGNVTQHGDFDGGAGTIKLNGTTAVDFTGTATTTAGDLPNVDIDKSGGGVTLVTSGGSDRIRTSKEWKLTNGTITAGTSKFVSAGATFSGSSWTLNDLDIRGATTVNTPVLTTGTLTLTSGNVTTGANVLHATGTVTRTSGHVVGKLRRTTSDSSTTYDIGTSSDHLPVTLTTVGASNLVVTASMTSTSHPNAGDSGYPIDQTKDINRYWTLTKESGTHTSWGATLRWVAGDLPGALDETKFIVGKRDSGTWSSVTPSPTPSQDATEITFTGQSSFSDLAVGEEGSVTISSVTSTTADGAYKSGATINVRVNFNASVTVNTAGGTPSILLETGATDSSAVYSGGSPGTAIDFTYTPDSDDNTADLNYQDGSIVLNGGTITKTGGGSVSLVLPTAAGASSLGSNKAIVIDTIAPSVTGATIDAGQLLPDPPGNARNEKVKDGAPFDLTGTAPTDTGGSGVSSVTWKACPGTDGCAFADGDSFTVGTDSNGAPWTTTFPNPSSRADGSYQVMARVSDAAGNTADIAALGFQLDNTAPTAAEIDLNGTLTRVHRVSSGDSHTIYFSTDPAGSYTFRLTSTITDNTGGSGPGSATFPAVTEFSAALKTDGLSPFDSNDYTVETTDTANPAGNPFTVTSRDAAGNEATADTVTFTHDSTGPAAPTVTAPTAAQAIKHPFDITLGAEPTVSGAPLDRIEARFCSGAGPCGAFTGLTLIGTDTTASFTGPITWAAPGPADGTYTVVVRAYDKVGNFGETTRTITVDNTVPVVTGIALTSLSTAGIAFKSGNDVWYRRATAGSFRLSTTATDTGGSGIASATTTGVTPAGAITHAGSTVTSASPVTSDAFSWTADATAAADQTTTVRARDAAGNDSTATTLTLRSDSVAPSAPVFAAIGPSDNKNVRSGVTIALTGDPTDNSGGAGLKHVDFFMCPGTNGCLITDGDAIVLTGSPDSGPPFQATVPNIAEGQYQLVARSVDNVENTSSTTVVVTNDNTAPAITGITLTGLSTAGIAHKSGNTVWYRGATAGSFQLSTAGTDTGGSGFASATTTSLPAGTISHTGTTVSGTSPITSGAFTWTAGEADRTTDVKVADGAGNESGTTTLTIRNDSTAPAAPAFAAIGGGSNNVKPGTVIALTGDPADNGGGSGLKHVDFFMCPGTNGCLIGDSDRVLLTGSPDTGTPYTATVPDLTPPGQPEGTWQLVARSVDNVDNTASTTVTVTYDETAPTITGITLTGLSAAGVAYKSGNTVWYRRAATGGGSFQLSTAGADTGGSGVASATTGAATPAGAVTHAGSTVTSGSPVTSAAYTWTESGAAAADQTSTVKVTDGSGNDSATTTLTLRNDSTGPGAPALAAVGIGGNNTVKQSTTISLTGDPADNTDGSGVKHVDFFMCPGTNGCTFADGDKTVLTGSPDTTAAYSATVPDLTNGSYQLVARAVDQLDNATESTPLTVTYDETDPTITGITLTSVSPAGAAFKNGNDVYYRSSAAGSLALSVAGDGTGSAITSATTTSIAAGALTHTGSTVSGASPVTTGTFSWTGAAANSTTTVTVADGSGNTSAGTTLTFRADASAPPAVSVTCDGGSCGTGTFYSQAAVTVGATVGADADSGLPAQPIRYTTDGSDPGTSSTALASGGTFSVGASANTVTTVKIRSVDNVGNLGPITSVVVNRDNGAPTLNTASYSGSTITLAYNETLNGTAPAGTAFEVKVNNVVTTVSTVTISGSNVNVTLGSAIPAGAAVELDYTVPVGLGANPIRDLAGNNAAAIVDRAVTAPAPPAAEDKKSSAPAPAEAKPVVTSEPPTVSSDSSAVFTVQGGGSLTCSLDGAPPVPCSSPIVYTNLNDGGHSLTVRSNGVVVFSRAWNQDTTGPTLTPAADWPDVTSDTGPRVAWTGGEPGGVTYCRLDGGAWFGCVSPLNLTGLAPGDHVFEIYATDALRNAGPVLKRQIKVVRPAGGDSPSSPTRSAEAQAGQAGSLATVGGDARVDWPAQAAPSGGLLMTIARTDDVTVNAGPGMLPFAVFDVSAFKRDSGQSVTDFGGAWVILTLDAPDGPVVIYTSNDVGKSWEVIPYVPGPGLPDGVRHGAIRTGNKITVLTRHLSLFALVGDTQAPSTPALAGDARAEGLRLSWQPSQDNSGQVARYVLLVDGAPAQTLGAATTETLVAGFSADDARSYQVVAEDHAGNRSAPSNALYSVPSLAGLTLEEARAKIGERGFTLGATSEADSTQPAGTVIGQSPGAPGVAARGSAVDLVLARGAAAGAKFVMRFATAKTVPLKKRRFIAVRVVVTKRANVVAVLRSPRNTEIKKWKWRVRAGATVLRIRIPSVVRRTGTYRLAIWAGPVGERGRVVKRVRIRLVGDDARKIGPAVDPEKKPVEVVLAGGGSGKARSVLNLKSRFTVSTDAQLDDAFERAAGLEGNAQLVVVVNAWTDGLAAVRQLRAVLPTARVVALVGRGQAAQARAAGAHATLPLYVGEAVLRRAIERVLD